MSSRRFRRSAQAAIAVALGAGVMLATGCGPDTASGDAEAGKQVFATCSGCHALADYDNSKDQATPPPSIGPDLDDAFRASREAGMDEDQFAGVVKRWIEIAQPPMQRNLVEGEDKENVAAYIASVAGKDDESIIRRQDEPTPEVPPDDRQQLDPPTN
ncbi:MAG: c-type cytochrome [Thermoleophilia bacterium]